MDLALVLYLGGSTKRRKAAIRMHRSASLAMALHKIQASSEADSKIVTKNQPPACAQFLVAPQDSRDPHHVEL
ncbi:MAG TPA: hypothetical protein VF749_08305 [Candidatus Acidoferrum sp.]